MAERSGPVVVGFDGSAGSRFAVMHAAWEAGRRDGMLHVLFGCVGASGLSPMPAGFDDNDRVVAAEEDLSEAIAWVRVEFPGLEVSTKVVAESGGKALVGESIRAGLIVVGSRGHGGFDGVRLGSVAAQAVTYARCSVIVVRRSPRQGNESTSGGVVVGIDGSARSRDAMTFAMDEAAARRVPLTAVHVWSLPDMAALSVGTVWPSNLSLAGAQLRQTAADVLSEALAGWQENFPEVMIRRRSIYGDAPAHALLEAAAETGADLIVVAARAGHRVGTPLGSVSRTLAAEAETSVAVVHPAATVASTV